MHRERKLFIGRCMRLLPFARVASMGVLMSVVSAQSAPAADKKPIRWLLAGQGIAAIAADAEASGLLDKSRPFVRQSRKITSVLPPSWDAVPFETFASFRTMQSVLGRGTLDPSLKAIMYDNEKWKFTPEEEQRDPARYEKLAADLVHQHGLMFLAAPAVDLIGVLEPGSRGKRYDAYLQLGIAGDAARYADVIDIQAQSAERDAEAYAHFVLQAAAQARRANPKVLVLAGVSTNPNGQRVTANDILGAITATRDSVDGYWLNIPRPSEYCPGCTEFRPDIAVEVLRRLAYRRAQRPNFPPEAMQDCDAKTRK